MALRDDNPKTTTKAEDKPIALPTGTIPPIQTAESLKNAVTLSTFVIAAMIGLYVLVTLVWAWLSALFLLALPERLEAGPFILDLFWYTLSCIVLVVLIFLIKPLLPLRRKQGEPIELTEEDQPELFAYIRALAKCIGAPEPERVLVDVHANASASFAGGMSPTSGPLTLTLGLPLIGGMSVRQLAGVIAHELGHFNQGAMIKQNIVIGFVSGWLTEVALGEDRFDYIVHRLTTNPVPMIRFPFKIIRTVTNAIRRVFYVVMVVGHMVTRLAARQLEYDADQYMAHTTGPAHFADTMRETIVLGHAGMQAIEDAGRFYRDRRLPNDLPAMVVTRARRMDANQRKKLLRGEDQDQAEAFATHPLTSKRIDKAAALNSEGLVNDDRPARGLFRDFDKLCQRASEALYKEVIGKEYDPKHLTDSSRLIAELEATDKARKAAQRFCQSDLLLMLPVFPTYRGLQMPDSPQNALEEIKELRQQARQMRDRAFPLMRKLNDANEKLMNNRQGYLAAQAGFEIRDFQQMGLEAGDASGLNRAVSDQTRVVEDLENQVRTYNADLIKRMELDFALLKHPKVTARIGQAKADRIWNEIEALVPAGQALASVQQSYENLRVQANILAMGVHLIMQGLISHKLISKIEHTAKETAGEIKDILRTLAAKPYPFAHGDGQVRMAEAVCEKPPDESKLGDILFVADDMAGRLIDLRERIIGRLCHHAERIEKVMGMKPLPAPDEPDALEDLLEKIGVDDSAPTQEESATDGLVGSLLVQGVMGVAVLVLSGYGVYATLPSDPSAPIVEDDRRPPQVARDDARPSGFNPPSNSRPNVFDSPRPDPVTIDPSERFSRPEPRPDPEPVELTVEEALRLMARPFGSEQLEGMRFLLEGGQTLSTAQASRAVILAGKIAFEPAARDRVPFALRLLDQHAEDKGLASLTNALRRARTSPDGAVMAHLGTIGNRQAADLLASFSTDFSLRRDVISAFKNPAVSEYAEDALLAYLKRTPNMRTNDRRGFADVLAEFSTAKSLPIWDEWLTSEDPPLRHEASDVVDKLDPKRNDAAAKFLRLSQDPDATSGALSGALSRLAYAKPGEDEDRQPQVCQAVLKWMKQDSRRGLDHTTLRVFENWGDAPAVPLYLELLKNERASRSYARTAIRLAGEQANDAQAAQAAEVIANWFLLETDTVAAGLIALGKHGEAPAIKHLKSKHAEVRMGCIDVLRSVGTQTGVKALQRMGSDPDRAVRDKAREAYYELRDRLKQEAAS